MKKIDTSNWKPYRVGDLFECQRGSVKKMQILKSGETPVIAAARSNQGVAGYYEVKAPYNNQITISCNGVGCGSSFFHDYSFNVNGDAIVLKEKLEISNRAKLYIACILDGFFTRKYSYEEKCSPAKAEAEIILLPTTPENQPDWEYMEQYIKDVEENTKNTLNILIS